MVCIRNAIQPRKAVNQNRRVMKYHPPVVMIGEWNLLIAV